MSTNKYLTKPECYKRVTDDFSFFCGVFPTSDLQHLVRIHVSKGLAVTWKMEKIPNSSAFYGRLQTMEIISVQEFTQAWEDVSLNYISSLEIVW